MPQIFSRKQTPVWCKTVNNEPWTPLQIFGTFRFFSGMAPWDDKLLRRPKLFKAWNGCPCIYFEDHGLQPLWLLSAFSSSIWGIIHSEVNTYSTEQFVSKILVLFFLLLADYWTTSWHYQRVFVFFPIKRKNLCRRTGIRHFNFLYLGAIIFCRNIYNTKGNHSLSI